MLQFLMFALSGSAVFHAINIKLDFIAVYAHCFTCVSCLFPAMGGTYSAEMAINEEFVRCFKERNRLRAKYQQKKIDNCNQDELDSYLRRIEDMELMVQKKWEDLKKCDGHRELTEKDKTKYQEEQRDILEKIDRNRRHIEFLMSQLHAGFQNNV